MGAKDQMGAKGSGVLFMYQKRLQVQSYVSILFIQKQPTYKPTYTYPDTS